MKIGDLARSTATAVETIRFYEREGLLPPPARTASNYRIYEARHAERLAFVRHCRSLDMTLAEIRALLHFKDAPGGNCAEVNALLDEHIAHVVRRIAELKALQGQLKALRDQCRQTQPAAQCGILKGLSAASAGPRKPVHQSHLSANHEGGLHGDSPCHVR